MWTRFKNRLLRQKPSSSGGSADGPGSLASPANKKWGDVLPTGVGTSSSEVSGSTRDDGCRSTRSTPERNKRTTIRSRFQLFGGKSSSPKKEDNGGSRTADRKSCDATKGGHDTGSPGTASNAESDDLQSGGGGAVSRTEAKIPGDGKKRTGRGAAGGKLEGSASLERTDRPSFTDYPVWIHRVWNDDDEDDDDDEEEDLKTSSSTTTTTPLPVPRGVSTFLERSSHDPLTASCAEKVSPPRLKRRKKTVPVVETESRKSRLTAGPPPRSLEDQEAAKVIGVAPVAVDGTRSPAKRVDPPRVPYDERPTVVVGGIGGVGVGVGGGGGMVPDEFSVKLERTLEQVTNDANDSPSTGEASPDDGTLVDSGLAGLGWRSDTSPLPLPPPPPLPVGPRIIPADGGVARLDVRTTTRKDKSMQSSSSPDFTSDDAEGKESGYVTLEDLQAQLTRSSWSGSDKESGKGGSGNGSTASSHLERKGGGLLLEETSEDMVDGGLMKMMEHGTTPPPPHHSARKSSSSSSSRPWTNHIDDEAAAATSDLSSVLQFTFTVKLESKMFRRRAGGQSLPATRDVSPSQVKGHELISYGGGGGGGGSTHCGRPLAAAMVAGTLDFVISDKTQQRSAMNYDDDEDEVVDEVGGDALPASSVKESTNFSSSSCSRWRTGDAELPCIDRSTTKDQETEAIRSPLGTIVSRLPSTKQKKMMVHADRDDLTTCSACGQTVVVAQDIGHPPHANGHRTGNATDAVSMATTMTPSTNGRSQGDGGRGGAGGGGTRRCSRRSSSSSKQLPLVELSDNNCYVCESDEDESESPEVDDSLLPVTSFTDDDGSYLRPLLSSSDDVTGGSRSSAICKSCKSAAAAVEAVACESLMTDSYKENEMTHMNWGEVLEEAKTLGIPLHHPPNITLSSFSSDCGGGGDRRSSKSSSVSSSFNRDFANSSSTINRLLSVKADATPKSPRGSSSSSSHHHHHHQQQQPQQHKVPPSSSSSKTGTTNVIRDLFRLQNFFSSSKSSNSSDNKENRRSSSKKSSRRSSDEVSEGSGSGGGGRHRTLMTPTSSPGPRLQSIQDRSLPPPPSSPSSPPDIDDGGGGGSSSRRPSRRSYPSRTSSICSRQGSSPMMSQSTSGPSAMRIVGCGSRAVSRSASSSRSRDYFLEEFGGSLGSSWSGGGCGGGGCVVGEGDVGMTSGVTSSKHRHMCISPSNSSFGSVFSQSSRGSSAVTPATPITPATPSADKTRSCTTNSGLFSFNKKHSQRDNDDFVTSLGQLQNCSWYWGPLSFEEAEQKLANRPDGTFIVRDSSDERYLLSLSFRSLGSTHHTRIEHYKGMFSFYSQPRSHCSAVTIVEFIEEAMLSSRGGQCLYYLRPRGPGQPPAPVRLVHPLSRFRCMHSLQHLCKFAVLRHVRLDLIDRLPIPPRLKEYLKLSQHHQHQHDHDFNSVLS